MNDTTRYQQTLLDEKARLEQELSSLGTTNQSPIGEWNAMPVEDGREADPGDQANALEGFVENATILHSLEKRYADVTAALTKVDAGTYGNCELCEAPIEAERLDADPAARTCIAHLNEAV
jgi:RNA polymerase-binding transcription factor DksA